jgi:hypothetical protein
MRTISFETDNMGIRKMWRTEELVGCHISGIQDEGWRKMCRLWLFRELSFYASMLSHVSKYCVGPAASAVQSKKAPVDEQISDRVAWKRRRRRPERWTCRDVGLELVANESSWWMWLGYPTTYTSAANHLFPLSLSSASCPNLIPRLDLVFTIQLLRSPLLCLTGCALCSATLLRLGGRMESRVERDALFLYPITIQSSLFTLIEGICSSYSNHRRHYSDAAFRATE